VLGVEHQRVDVLAAVRLTVEIVDLENVVAEAAFQDVKAAAAFQDVVAATALETVVAPVADELVVVSRADDVFDAEDEIAFGRAAFARAGSQIDFNGLRRVGVEDGVASGVAADPVGAAATLDGVVAASGDDVIAAGIADDGVVAVGDAVDPVERLAGRIRAFCLLWRASHGPGSS
jgi:hypothetical protein